MTEGKILKQIEELNKRDDYRGIIDLVKNLDEKDQTPPVLCELARACNNLAVLSDPDDVDREMLLCSVEVLRRIKDDIPENDHLYNFRFGYALFYLDRIGEALERFKKALIERPDDEDTKEFIEMCLDRLTLPVFRKNFSQRIKEGWEKFAAGEAELRRLISEKADSDEITGCCHELLEDTFTDPCFEVGFNGEKYDLILSPEKDKYMLYLFDVFRKHAPESVTKHWNIFLGRQPASKLDKFELGFHGRRLAPSDVTVRIDQDENGDCMVTGYSETLAQVLGEDRNEAFWFFDMLLDMALGEIVNMRYVDTIDLSDKPFESGAIPLLELRDVMKERFGEKEDWDSAESYLDTVSGFEMKPREFAEDEYPTPRLDSFVGFSCVPQFMIEYINGEHDAVNKADNDGVAAGFIFFPVHVFEDDENTKRGEKILNFRDELESFIVERAGGNVVFIGGASGIDNCYLDFLAFDIRAVLDAAVKFFSTQKIVPWAYYQSYRTDVKVLALMRGE
ncbi:MAG: hypothetical protein K2N56_06725 [Oscillospiraceae bacterium]|nr:hypothetical protein [Oscillospiraceae bacterium]